MHIWTAGRHSEHARDTENVGVFGLEEVFACPTPWTNVPTYVVMGAMQDAPAVVDGQVVVRKQLTLTTTIDHRYMDGAQGGKLATVIREVIEHPFRALEGLQGPPP